MPQHPTLWLFACMGVGLWAFLPIALLSAMSSARWTPLSFKVVYHLLRLAPATLAFYILTAAVLIASLGMLYIGLLSPTWLYLLPTAMVVAAGLLIHARLVGRMGRLLNELEQPVAKRPPRKEATGKPRRKRRSKSVKTRDPWEVPDEEEATPPHHADVIAMREDIEEKPPRPSYLDPEPEPYAVAPAKDDDVVRDEALRERSRLDEGRVEREVALRTREAPEPLRFPLTEGVWTFPFYDSCRKHAIGLVIWLFLTLATLRQLLIWWMF